MNQFDPFSELDLGRIAKTYQTPLYIFSADVFSTKAKILKQAFEKAGYPYEINFAGKSNLNLAMARLTEREGLSLDTASGGELYTALSAGFPAERITFHGSNKSEEEIRYALTNGVGRIVIDSISERDRIADIAGELGLTANVLFRVNPGIDAHTNELINTGKTDTKFGIPLDQVNDALLPALENEHLNVLGLHCHVGSQVTDASCFVEAARILADLYARLEVKGANLTELNLGGGFGIAYRPGDPFFDPATTIPEMMDIIHAIFEVRDLPMPKIMVEPGRFLSAEAGITLYTIGTVKEIGGVRTYVSVDGGMADNPRPALYGALYDAYIPGRELREENAKTVRVSGKACETDTLIPEIVLADPREGDLLVVKHTGAYNYSMASNYNRLPKPAVLLLDAGREALIVKRESWEDLLSHDTIPDFLER